MESRRRNKRYNIGSINHRREIGYLRCTGLPFRFKNSNLVQALAKFDTSNSDDILLLDMSRFCNDGVFFIMLLVSTVSMTLPDRVRLLRRNSRGKFSRRLNRLSVKSIASKASRVTAKCSIMGMARPRKTTSRSPNGFVRCSQDPISSADNLIMSNNTLSA